MFRLHFRERCVSRNGSLRIKIMSRNSQRLCLYIFSFDFFFLVEECKKRWRSLRDAFMKQYKLYSRGDVNIKKKWLFYEQMEFLGPYFDT